MKDYDQSKIRVTWEMFNRGAVWYEYVGLMTRIGVTKGLVWAV